MAPKKKGQQKKAVNNNTQNRTNGTTAGGADGLLPPGGPASSTTVKTNYEELQQNEMMVLQSIYFEDFVEQTDTHSAWKKAEPSFDIRIKARADEDIAVTLGVVLVATYPKSPPLLTLKDFSSLREATLFKVQKYVETQPTIFAKEEQEMVDRLVEGIRDILEEAAEAKAAGRALPTLEEERAAHAAAEAKKAQQLKEQEDIEKMEADKENNRVAQQQLDDELKRQRERQLESKRKNRPFNVTFVDLPRPRHGDAIVFDQLCKHTDNTGNTITFNAVSGKSKFRRGPTTEVFEVRPILENGQEPPRLALKEIELHSDGKDLVQFRKQLQTLDAQLEQMKRLRHQAIVSVLDYRINRDEPADDADNAMSWKVLILSPLSEDGSLESVLRWSGDLNANRARSFTASLLEALGWLHSHGLAHKDIHPGNILLVTEPTGDMVAKLTDVAYQKELHNLASSTKTLTSMTNARSAYWFPTEIASSSTPQYTQKTDIWDFGMVFLQMILGLDVAQKYHSPKDLMESLSLSDSLEELLSAFFNPDPKKRPRAFELSSSEFLATDAPVFFDKSQAVQASGSMTATPDITPIRSRPRHDSVSARHPFTSRYKEDFVEEGRLGRGGFGEVVKARKKLDGQIYAIKKISQRSQDGLTEVLKEVRLLSQLSHPAVVRYYNTWLEEVYGSADANTDDDASTEAGTIGYSRGGTSRGGTEVEFAASQGGLDFISSGRHVSMPGGADDFAIEFGSDSEDGQDDNEQDEDGGDDGDEDEEYGDDEGDDDDESESESESEEETEGKQHAAHGQTLTLPERRANRRLSHRPFRTVMYISMEYCEKRTLRDLIHQNLYKNKTEVWRLFRQILQGLVHIHSLNIVHRDLKPDNIFIAVGPDGVNNVKIGDFGLASKGQIATDKSQGTLLDQTEETRSVGTAVYVAPEVRSGGSGNYTSKVDMYSLGIMSFEMWSPPMLSMERAILLEDLRRPNPQLPSNFDPGTAQADIILSLVTHNPKERPSSVELLKSNKLPDEMESDTTRRAIASLTDPNSAYYEKVLSTFFSPQVDNAKDFAWDMNYQGMAPGDALRQRIVKETLVSIFKCHGGLERPTFDIYPYSPHYQQAVKLLDQSGTLLQLPYDLIMGHARMLAKSNSPIMEESYAFGSVFRGQHIGGQPNKYAIADFDIVTRDTLDLALNEARLLAVCDDVIAAFPQSPLKQMAFHISHSDLLQIIFDYCGVERSSRPAAAEVLSKLNISAMNWPRLRGELRAPTCGVSATSVDELQRFDFRDTPVKAFSKLKSLFEGTDYYQKASPTIAHLKEVAEYCKIQGLKTKVYVTPLHCFNEAIYKGGFMFACVHDRKVKQVFAAGGRYDSLIKEHRHKAGTSLLGERHAVGISFAWDRLATLPFKKSSGKTFLKKATEEDLGIFKEKRRDALVASFDPVLRRTTALEIVRTLETNGISAQLAREARSPDELIPDGPDEQPAWLIIVKSDNLKVKTLWTRDTPECDIPARQLLNWLRGEIRERDSALKITTAKLRTGIAQSEGNTVIGDISGSHPGSSSFGASGGQRDIRVLTGQTKSKKFNRQTVVEQAQMAASKLVQGFHDGPIAVIETTDAVLQAIRSTSLSEPETWRKLDINNAEKKYVRDVQDMLAEFRDDGAKHAFVYNFRTGTCVFYDLEA